MAPNRMIAGKIVARVRGEGDQRQRQRPAPAASTTTNPIIGTRVTMRPPASRANTDVPASAVVAIAAVLSSVRSSTSLTSCWMPPTWAPRTSDVGDGRAR